MRRLLTWATQPGVLLSLGILTACGGESPTPPPQLRPASLSIVAGDAQQDTIKKMLANPIEVVVTAAPSGRLSLSVAGPQGVSAQVQSAGMPVPNQLVNWVVVEEGCGRPFAGSAITDSQGRAKERWELGTKAGLCHMEARAVDQATGEPIVFDTATAIALPGPAVDLRVMGATVPIGTTFPARDLIVAAFDAYQNRIAEPSFSLVPPAGWTISGGELVPPTTESAGTLVVLSGNTSATAYITAVRDLRAFKWSANWTCYYPGSVISKLDNGSVYVDSLVYSATVDSIVYPTPREMQNGQQDAFYWTGRMVRYWRDNTVDTVIVSTSTTFIRQAPDSLIWYNSNRMDLSTSIRTSTNPLTYEGGLAWCPVLANQGRALRLVAQ
jgi:hypothetical protein